jgi:hypothetical protein
MMARFSLQNGLKLRLLGESHASPPFDTHRVSIASFVRYSSIRELRRHRGQNQNVEYLAGAAFCSSPAARQPYKP